jgi:transposase
MSNKLKRKNKSYSAEFKLKVVKDIEHNYLSYPEVRNKYFPYAKSSKNLKFVHKWIEIYKHEAVEGFMDERRERKAKQTNVKESTNNEGRTMKDLLKENERLRVEN